MKKISIELNDDKIVQKGVNSIIDFYHALAIDERSFFEATAFATGVDSPFLNVLFDFRSARKNSTQLIETANNFFNQHHAPWGWFITPASTDHDLIQQGFSLLEEVPAMYFDLSTPLPNPESKFISIQELGNDDDLRTWIQPINEGFQAKEGEDSYRKLNADIVKKGENKFLHFVAYYKDQLAAASTLFLSNDGVMLHNLATKPDFKNHGLGTALTLHMMTRAKKLGFKDCFLDSSEEAFRLYKKIGFKVYCTTFVYCKT